MRCDNSNERNGRILQARHGRQVGARLEHEYQELQSAIAITFRPGDRTGSFLNQPLRTLGSPVLVVLSYGPGATGDRPLMPLAGFRAAVDQRGLVTYGGPAGRRLFYHNAARRPSRRAWAGAINPWRNPSLVELALQMDRQCLRRLPRAARWPVVPRLPKILLGFPPGQPPTFEVTSRLHELVAGRLEVPVEQLGANGSLLLDRMLRDVWEENWIRPEAPENNTGLLLVSAELCTQAHQALRVYEDFSDLLGVATWNPARVLEPLRLPNPARKVLAQFNVDEREDFEQVIPHETVLAMERSLRGLLGTLGTQLTTKEVFDAITCPAQTLVAWSPVLPALRRELNPAVSECVSDDDLLQATADPAGPLWASGACSVQVLRRRSDADHEALCFAPEDLGRRIVANLVAPRAPEHTRERTLVGAAG